ncbi:MAG: hypothetical protein NZL85_09455 [Fimbriimonadales bacterium]|nr:hypothetical protein [Fimbriimonadales bacterium]
MRPRPFAKPIDGEALRAWLESMRQAEARTQHEQTRWLQQLSPAESLAIYHDLWQSGAPHRDLQKPSEYILRLQRVYRRILEARAHERSSTGSP